MAFISSGLRIEHDDRPRIEVRPLARLSREIGSRVSARHIQQTGGRIQSVGRPGGAAGDGCAGRVFPGRHVKGRRALGPACDITLGLRHEVKFPDDLAGLGVESVHAPLHTLDVSPRIADKNEAVPCNRGGGHGFAFLGIGDRHLPEALSGLEIISQDAAVLGATKQFAVHISGPAIDALRRRRRVIFVGTPILAAIGRINRENIVFRRSDQSTVDFDQPAREARVLARVVGAKNFQIADIFPVDQAKL